jgi:(2R)-ethylmalonyl-CoA mutase
LSRDHRARAIQLPAWNEALGLPRPWDQQWSLRIQQVLAYETDLLEHQDLLEGSKVVEQLTSEMEEAAESELHDVLERGGAFAAIEELKSRLVASQAERMRRIESGEQIVVGVNSFTESEPSPLYESASASPSILVVDPSAEAELRANVVAWRASRDAGAVGRALDELRRVAATNENLMPATIALAHAGGTTGEWADALREQFGEYRGPTGISGGVGRRGAELRGAAEHVRAVRGGPPRLLVAKPGLDGHSNGAEQIAVAARDAGFEVVYQGIRLSPDQIAAAAHDEDVDVIGISILSGSHLELVPQVLDRLRARGVLAPVVVGGIIPEADQRVLRERGVAAIYTPKDYVIGKMLAELADLAAAHRDLS